MTQEDIIRMAREASTTSWCYMPTTLAELERFAALVAAAATEAANARATSSWTLMCKKMVAFENEACARVCDDINAKYKWPQDTAERVASQWCADAIRARGQA